MNKILKSTILTVAGIGALAGVGQAPLPNIDVPTEQRLVVSQDNILGYAEIETGIIKYAYKADKIVDLENEIVDRRTNNSRTIFLGVKKERVNGKDKEMVEYQTEFISGDPQYYEDESGEWYQADYAKTTKEAYDKQTGPQKVIDLITGFVVQDAFATDSTFYPVPGTTCSGYMELENISWATVRGAADASSVNTTNLVIASRKAATYIIRRGVALFTTSAIPDTDTITSATMSLCGNDAGGADQDSTTVEIVSSNPADSTTLATGDYDSLGSTSFGSISMTGWSTSGYNNITLNASGIAAISKTGITKFGFISGLDLNNSAPVGVNQVNSYAADGYAGTTKDPKLVVTHSAPRKSLIVVQ